MNRRLLLKIFWRLILPFILACLLATGLTFEVIGRTRSSSIRSFFAIGPPWLRFGGLYLVGGIFIFFLLTSLWNALKWGKESEEYADLLNEEEAEETRSQRKDLSE
jgi:hypothetical protein